MKILIFRVCTLFIGPYVLFPSHPYHFSRPEANPNRSNPILSVCEAKSVCLVHFLKRLEELEAWNEKKLVDLVSTSCWHPVEGKKSLPWLSIS